MKTGLSGQLKLFYELHKETLSEEIEDKKRQTGTIILVVLCLMSPLALLVLLPLDYFVFTFFERFWGVSGAMLGVLIVNLGLLALTVHITLRLLTEISTSRTVAELKKDVDMLMKGVENE